MKRLMIGIIATLAFVAAAWAQTPEEILQKMDKAMEPAETQGLSMAMDMKIPIIGTTTTMLYMLGDKARSETKVLKHLIITFSDGVAEYEYDTVKNELVIKDAAPSDEGSEAELLSDITDGYDLILKKETADAWHLQCKKSKTNNNKDDPSKMDLVVSKATNLPVSLSTKVSGVRVTLRDVKIGIDPKLVTFDMADYPDATIVDKRGEKK